MGANQEKNTSNGEFQDVPYDSQTAEDKEKITQLTEYEGYYEALSLDPLMLYTFGEMEKRGIRISTPNATVAVWKIFPKKFTLFGWSGVPDGARAANTIWHLVDKKKKWVTGTANEMTLTERGRKKLEDSMLMVNQPGGRKSYSQTRRPEKLIRAIKNSAPYKKYEAGKDLTEFDLRKVLQCTLDSPQPVLKENYDSMCVHAEAADAQDVIHFLLQIKKNFKEVIYGKSKVKNSKPKVKNP